MAFYERLFDVESVCEQIVPWLSPRVRADTWVLCKARVDDDKLAELSQLFGHSAESRWLELRVPTERTPRGLMAGVP